VAELTAVPLGRPFFLPGSHGTFEKQMCTKVNPQPDGPLMNTAIRTLALTLGTAATLAGCGDDSKPVGDVLAEDSTLAREVMMANRDSLATHVDTAETKLDVPESAATQPAVAASPRIETPSPAEVAAPVNEAPVRRVAAGSHTRSRRSARIMSSSAGKRTVSARTSMRSTTTNTVRIKPEATTRMRSSALIPAGSELVLAANQRVCASMSRVGDEFQVRVAEDVGGPIGVVIPKGTLATAQIASVRNDFDLDIASITFAGHTYPIESDVTSTEVEKVRAKSRKQATPVIAGAGLGAAMGGVIGRDVKSAVIGAAGGALAGALASRQTYRKDRCVPEGGRITTTLTEPLKIALTE
jgi:hypothetical protein